MKSILYVDDVFMNLEVFEELLSNKFTVYTAISGEVALLMLNEKPIDLVVSDMKMPRMNGVDFIKEIRKTDDRIPCYILTSYADSGEIKEAMDQGILNGYFIKPFDTDELVDTIATAIQNSCIEKGER